MRTMMNRIITVSLVVVFSTFGMTADVLALTATNVGFDNGTDGGFTGNAFYETSGGNPDGNAHFFVQAFGMSLRTGGVGETTNPDFLGDYTEFDGVTISFDIQVNSITNFFGGEIPAAIGVSLIDRDIQGGSGPSGVFFEVDVVSAATHADWVTLSLFIDTSLSDLPDGAVGFGDEDPNTFEPILPAGASFQSVLAGVDEFQITTFVPGFFFTNSNYDVRIDNISVSTVPVPGGLILLLSGLTVLGVRLRK